MDCFLEIFRNELFFKVLYMDMSLYFLMRFVFFDIYNMFCAIFIQYFTQNLFIFYVNSIQYEHLITDDAIILLCSYIK